MDGMSITKGRYSFHWRAGYQAQITNKGLTATRTKDSYCDAVLIGSQPLEDGRMFEVRIEATVTEWSGSITIGCTTSRPDTVSLPSTLYYQLLDIVSEQRLVLPGESWIMGGSTLVKHGQKLQNPFQQNTESLNIGETVGIARIGRKLKFYINGIDQGTAEDNLPPTVYPMVDLYGKCTQVSIVLPGELYGAKVNSLE